MIGVGYRRELAGWIATRPASISCLEITAEHFFDRDEAELEKLADDYHLFVHGLGLSLGTPGPIDASRLKTFARIAHAAKADWVSEHIAFTRTSTVDLGHLNPVRPTHSMVEIIAEHAREVADVCGKPIILENITSHLPLQGDLAEPDFLNAICARADCGLLLDVTNLYINSRNHGFDPLAWLAQVEPRRIVQLHVVGYSMEHGRYTDNHAMPVQREIIDLARAVVAYGGGVKAVILERDAAFPDAAEMEAETTQLADLFERD